jgi:uncharacterized RDD family membrane protein YckC
LSNAPLTQPDPFAPPTSNLDPRYVPGDDMPLAGRGTRLGAQLLDGLILTPLVIIGGVIGFVLFGKKDPAQMQTATLAIGGLMFVCILPLIAYQWYLVSTTGQTLAKKWLKIKIVKRDGSPVNFVSAVILRQWVLGLANFAGGFGSLVSLIDSLFIFSDDRRTLHDRIAGTKVISVG